MGSIINPTPAATMLEEQRLGYIGCSLTNFDNTLEPQIVGNLEIAGSLGSFASAESITGWSGLSNGDVYVKVVPDTGAGTVAAEFTATAPTWNGTRQGWYGTGGSANERYLFKLEKTGASGYEDKRLLNNTGDSNEVVFKTNQDLETTDNVVFNEITGESISAKIKDASTFAQTNPTRGDVYTFLSSYLSVVGEKCFISGGFGAKYVSGADNTIETSIISYAERASSTTINFIGVSSLISYNSGSVDDGSTNIQSGTRFSGLSGSSTVLTGRFIMTRGPKF